MTACLPKLALALIGGESTGKSTLAQALGQRCQLMVLEEELRRFCDQHQRTPTAQEQATIIRNQQQLETHVRATVIQQPHWRGWVADSTPLATAIYSQMYFDDDTLLDLALSHQRTYDLTLVADHDLPWQSDGLMRDGPQYRDAFHTRLLSLLERHQIPYALITGLGHARLESAERVVRRHLLGLGSTG